VRAALCPEFGPPRVVSVVDQPAPALGAGQIRVAVAAASVNFPDVLLVAGEYQIKVPPPFVPGSEFAGTVVEVGDEAEGQGVALGDRVFGTGLVGAFAEEMVVAPAAVTRIPEGVDEAHAAAFGVAHRTAYHVLRSVAAVQPGEQVVVLGAGGGVGLAAVQLASLLGAEVIAVASSPEKLAVAERYGATHLIDHTSHNGGAGDLRQALREARPDGTDVVVDPVGGDLAEAALRSLHWGGRFVTVGYASGTIPRIPLNLVLLKGIHILGFEFLSFMTHLPEEAERNETELLALLASGQALPHIGASFALDDVVAALDHVGDGAAIGKVVLVIGDR
jgi:NADPH2:quinone reductase